MTSPIADYVVSLDTDGRIKSQGTVSDALKRNRALQKEFKYEQDTSKRDTEQVDNAGRDKANEPDNQGSDGKLIIAEEMAEGHVGWPASEFFDSSTMLCSKQRNYPVKMLFASMGGRWPVVFWIIMLLAFLICESTNTISTWFLGYWYGMTTFLFNLTHHAKGHPNTKTMTLAT